MATFRVLSTVLLASLQDGYQGFGEGAEEVYQNARKELQMGIYKKKQHMSAITQQIRWYLWRTWTGNVRFGKCLESEITT